ncbi:MAG: peptidylprolyl isomerase [Bacteroidales bacterium]|nr:peptidylprolyl isomerase [Bacteroidales bacterium]
MLKKNYLLLVSVLLLFLALLANTDLKAQGDGKTIDKIVAIVGDNIIMHSDIENQYMQYVMQGYTRKKEIRCQIFEEMLFQKMLLNKAEIDSITVSRSQVNSELDRRMRYFIRQIGSEQKLEEYYNKSVTELKEELRGSIREQLLVSEVQRKLTEDVKITPSEVKDYYNSIPTDSLPKIPEEYRLAEITIIPEVSHEDKVKTKQKLQEIRQRILNGSSFKILAGLYSEDPGSADNGGELGLFTKGEMYPEFEAAAFNLVKGEISPIIETKPGFHIIQLIERQGDYVNARHILLRKKVSAEKLMQAKFEADSIRQQIINIDTLDFLEAAALYSDTYKQSSAGIMLNRQTGSTRFTPDQMKQKTYFSVEKLKPGGISKPFQIETSDGAKAIRFVKVIEKTKPHRANLNTDYDRIKTAALEQKKSKVIKEWVNDQAGETFIKILEKSYKKCDFTYEWFEKNL